jgi:hypothetical protein
MIGQQERRRLKGEKVWSLYVSQGKNLPWCIPNETLEAKPAKLER